MPPEPLFQFSVRDGTVTGVFASSVTCCRLSLSVSLPVSVSVETSVSSLVEFRLVSLEVEKTCRISHQRQENAEDNQTDDDASDGHKFFQLRADAILILVLIGIEIILLIRISLGRVGASLTCRTAALGRISVSVAAAITGISISRSSCRGLMYRPVC